MGAAVARIGKNDAHGTRPFLFFRLAVICQHQADIIGVAKGNITLPGKD